MTHRLPHARGGVSSLISVRVPKNRSSPRPWGCFLRHDLLPHEVFVFPTPVGVFPDIPIGSVVATSLPHARGGVSEELLFWALDLESSPRPWGCF